MDVAPVLSVAVFQQGQELQERAKTIVVFQAIVLCDFFEQLDIFLVQDAPVLIPDLSGCPFNIRAIESGSLSPAGAADGRPHDARHFAEYSAAVGDGGFQGVLVDELRRHPDMDELPQRLVAFLMMGGGIHRWMQIDVLQEDGLIADRIELLAVEQGARDGVNDGAIGLHHDLAAVMEDRAGFFQVRLVHVVDQDQRDAVFPAVNGRGNMVDDRDQAGDIGIHDLP